MGAGHSHGAPPSEVTVSTLARWLSIGILVIVALVTMAGVTALWPAPGTNIIQGAVGGTESVAAIESARVVSVAPCTESEVQGVGQDACAVAQATLLSGDKEGSAITIDLIGVSALSGIKAGDVLQVSDVGSAYGMGETYALVTIDRTTPLAIFAVVFVAVVIAVAGWKGVRGLLGLVLAGAVFFGFVLPALASGQPPVAVALTGGSLIMFAVLYLAHGISMRTTSAFVGTLISLLITAALGSLAVSLGRLSGLTTDETLALASYAEGLRFADLLTASIIIAGLGVLNDTTITQSSAVWELRAAGPGLSRRELFTSGMRIGRDHIASTIYTIVFAYAGAALATLLVVSSIDQPLGMLLSTEPFAEEIFRTLGSSIGLVLSVPLTTGVAALTVAGPVLPPRRAA